LNRKTLLYIALLTLLLTLMPNALSLYSGQHTFYGKNTVSCSKCHLDIHSEIQSSQQSVYNAHKNAAANTNYTTYLAIAGIDYDPVSGTITTNYDSDGIGGNDTYTWNATAQQWSYNGTLRLEKLDKNDNGIDGDEICYLCHSATLYGLSTHSNVTVRACDDDRCHGNRNHAYNDPDLFTNSNYTIVRAGSYFNNNTNAHHNFYYPATNQSSRYNAGAGFNQTPGNEVSGKISKGFYTCEGCHTQTSIEVEITYPEVYDHSDENEPKGRYR
jgi:hypothetical protein